MEIEEFLAQVISNISIIFGQKTRAIVPKWKLI